MRSRSMAVLAPLAGLVLAGVVLAGCGGASRSRALAGAQDEGTIRMALSDVPTLDPARAVTAQQTELDWALYTGLVTYRHASGESGTRLIAGVAGALPRVSDGGRLYTVTLRHGLRFSDGRAVRAADVVATIERVLRIPASPVRPLLLRVLSGAAAFAAGDARSLSGVTADEASGRVTIRLRRPDAAFDALLAEPALGIVPAGTPARERPGHPPPGIGPYRLVAVHPGRSFTLARNPRWTALPGIPAGRVDIEVLISRNVPASALAVLNGVLDVEDPAQVLPPATLTQVRRLGEERTVTDGPPLAGLFLDTDVPPFDSGLAREAVLTGLGAQTLAQAAARGLSSICDVVPEITGSSRPVGCPTGMPAGGALAAAQLLAARSGTAGAPVSVWAPRSGPEREWMEAEAAMLRSIGYPARLVTMPDTAYRSELAALLPRVGTGGSSASGRASAASTHASASSTHASTGGRSLLARRSGQPVATVAADTVVDGRLGSAVHVSPAGAVPVVLSPDVARRVARRGTHLVTFVQPAIPELMSWRMNEAAAVIDPVEGLDFTSLRLR